MSSVNALAALYAEQPDYMIEDKANDSVSEHDGTHEDTGVPPASVAINPVFDPTAPEFVPAALTAASTPPNATPANPETVLPVGVPTLSADKPATQADTLLAIFTSRGNISWADESEEELRVAAVAESGNAAPDAEARAAEERETEVKAAAEAQAQAEFEAEEKEAEEGSEKAKKSKKRNQCKKKTVVTDAGSPKVERSGCSAPHPDQEEEYLKFPVANHVAEAVGESNEETETAEATMPTPEEDVLPVSLGEIGPAQVEHKDEASLTVATSANTMVETTPGIDLQPSLMIAADTQSTTTSQEPDEAAPVAEQAFVLEAIAETYLEESAGDEIAPAGPSEERLIESEAAEPAAEVKEVAATDVAPATPVDGKKLKTFHRRKNKKASNKVQTATLASPSPSSTIEKHPNDGAKDTGGLRDSASATDKSNMAPEVPPGEIKVESVTASAASSEPATEVSKPAATAAADSWDDWVETVPTIEGRNREFELIEEAQAWYAASVPSVDDVVVTTAELQRRHEEAEQARRSAALASGSYAQAVVDAASVVENLPEPDVEADEVEPPLAPTFTSAHELEADITANTAELPAPVPESRERVPYRAPGQRSITDFFKKGLVVTVREVSSASTPQRVTSPVEPVEAVIVEAPASVGSSKAQEKFIDHINVADYLDYQPDTDDEEDVEDAVLKALENAENLPAASNSTAVKTEGDQVAPEPAAAIPFAQHIDAEGTVSGETAVDQTTTPDSGANKVHEPVVARQKKKRSRAQRDAAKKRVATAATATATATTAAIPATVAEEPEPANVALLVAEASSLKPTRAGRANRTEKRTGRKPSGSGVTSKRDARQISVTLTEGTFADPEHQERRTIRQKLDAMLAAVFGTISDKAPSCYETVDRGGKAPVKTHDMRQPQSVDELGEVYHMMIAQTGAEASNKDREKYIRKESHRRAEEIRLKRQPGQSAAMKPRIADMHEERVVVKNTGTHHEANAGPNSVKWFMTALAICFSFLLGMAWLDDIFSRDVAKPWKTKSWYSDF